MNIIIVGVGGIGSWLYPSLLKLVKVAGIENIHLVDGDEFTEENLDRQLFDQDTIGANKAQALSLMWEYDDQVSIYAIDEWFDPSAGWIDNEETDVIFCCADNHQARRHCLSAVDMGKARYAIIAANEYTDAEAYIYKTDWYDTHADPRTYYPDILSDNSGARVHAFGCQGTEAETKAPQLVLANQAAANAAMFLFWGWLVKPPQIADPHLYRPLRHSISLHGWSSTNWEEFKAINEAKGKTNEPQTING